MAISGRGSCTDGQAKWADEECSVKAYKMKGGVKMTRKWLIDWSVIRIQGTGHLAETSLCFPRAPALRTIHSAINEYLHYKYKVRVTRKKK